MMNKLAAGVCVVVIASCSPTAAPTLTSSTTQSAAGDCLNRTGSSCFAIELDAASGSPAFQTTCNAITARVPDVVELVQGNDAPTAHLKFGTASCNYRLLDGRYLFQSCDNGALAGGSIVASQFELRLAGSPNVATHATAIIAEVPPCGCADSDGDGVCDSVDNCPATPNPSQADADHDGIGDACDPCPNDPLNDVDGDGICGNVDNCPTVANPTQADADHDGIGDACDACPNDPLNDVDGDGICGNVDNCPTVANPTQADADHDGIGDACDACPNDPLNDVDGDGVCGDVDNCPTVANPTQADADHDGIGDACDACPNDPLNDVDHDGVCGDVDNCPTVANPTQADADHDGIGDACDACPHDPLNDIDGDGVCGDVDNCPTVANPTQSDLDHDGIGDACDPDADGDGFTVAQGDCNDFDASIHPGAVEICGDGIDQNCDGHDEPCSSLPPDPSTLATPLGTTSITRFSDAYAFLAAGTNPVQTGVAAGTIAPQRAAVVRGRVLDVDGTALGGVTVTILGHPELGQTLSRADGAYDLLVNGGGRMTVAFSLAGYVSVERSRDISWHTVSVVDDVVLTPLDSHANAIALNAAAPQVARGSEIIDDDGARTATFLFLPGTDALMTFPDGTSSPLPPTITLHATELTVGPNGPLAMPAPLPPSSAYTYCVDVTVDEAREAGATGIDLSQPVPMLAENFLGFPVGATIPMGLYVAGTSSRWQGEPDAHVIAVVGVSGGLASIDVDGDGVADSSSVVATLGISDEERASIATLYPVGTTLMRGAVTRFSRHDINGSANPATPEGNGGGRGDDHGTCHDTANGSIIDVEDQILGESIPIGGTPYSLEYRSDRVPGRLAAYELDVDTGTSKPADATASATAQVLGRTFPLSIDASGLATFLWDGNDAYGRRVQGMAPAEVTISYERFASYGTGPSCAGFGQSFPLWSCTAPTAQPTTRTVQVGSLVVDKQLGTIDARAQKLGGFTLNVHHMYSPAGEVIYRGDGAQRGRTPLTGRATAVKVTGLQSTEPAVCAGHVVNGGRGDGTLAPCVSVTPSAMTFLPDGRLLFIDAGSQQVRVLDFAGVLSTIAGVSNTTQLPSTGDDGPALAARFEHPVALAVADDGSFYVGDDSAHRVRHIRADGIVEAFAGNGSGCRLSGNPTCGDGGAATAGTLDQPRGLALLGDGTLLIADPLSCSVRRVDDRGILSTIAGSRACTCAARAGLLAENTGFCQPTAVAVNHGGEIGIIDDNVLFVVGRDGIVRFTNPTTADAPSHGSAIPSIFVGADDSFYFSFGGQGFSKRDVAGRFTLVAGNSLTNSAGREWAIDPSGRIYSGDEGEIWRIDRTFSQVDDTAEIAFPTLDGQQRWVFDGGGRHLRTEDIDEGTVLYSFAYDGGGLLTSVTDKDSLTTTIERDSSGEASAIVGPYGERTELAMNGDGWLSEVSRADGAHSFFTYQDAGGLLATMIDPRSGSHSFTFDADGRLASDTDAANKTQTLTRTRSGRLDVHIDHATAEGRTTSYVVSSSEKSESTSTTHPDATTSARGFDRLSGTARTADGSVISRSMASDTLLGATAIGSMFTTDTSSFGSVTSSGSSHSVIVNPTTGAVTSDTRTASVDTATVTSRWTQRRGRGGGRRRPAS
jgi:YD repeat-containing protein